MLSQIERAKVKIWGLACPRPCQPSHPRFFQERAAALFWNIGTWWFGLQIRVRIGALIGVALGNASSTPPASWKVFTGPSSGLCLKRCCSKNDGWASEARIRIIARSLRNTPLLYSFSVVRTERGREVDSRISKRRQDAALEVERQGLGNTPRLSRCGSKSGSTGGNDTRPPSGLTTVSGRGELAAE